MTATPNWSPNGSGSPLGPYASTTLSSIVETAARRLEGDLSFEIFAREELETYAQIELDQFAAETKAFWDSRHLPDKHVPAYTTDVFAADGVISERIYSSWSAPASGTDRRTASGLYEEIIRCISDPPVPFMGGGQEFARQDGISSEITSPADIQGNLNAPPADTVLPADVLEVERATWDGRPLQALGPREADELDSQWERYPGWVAAFALIQRGARKLFKRFRGPAAPADTRPHTQQNGILRGGRTVSDTTTITVVQENRITLTPFAIWDVQNIPTGRISTLFPYPATLGQTVSFPYNTTTYGWSALTETEDYSIMNGPFGFVRRMSGVWFTNGPFGFPRRWCKGESNTRIDYVKRAPKLSTSRLATTTIPLQDWDCRYILFGMLARAYSRDGQGQNKKLAKHYDTRRNLGILDIKRRHANVREELAHVMGGGSMVDALDRAPLAQLPWNYGRQG